MLPGRDADGGVHRVRFGLFQVDLATGDVWKAGVRVRIHGRPFQVLALLLERRGEVVTRPDLRQRLWPDDTHVEFENGLNNAISRLRDALGDAADNPRFIETIPRRGYRFIAPLEVDGDTPAPAAAPLVTYRPRGAVLAVVVLAVAASAITYWALRPSRPALQAVAVLPFVTADGESGTDEYLAFGITDALTSELARVPALRVISQTSASRYRTVDKRLPEIARDLRVGAVVEGSLVREGEQLRVTMQLIDAARDTHLWAESYRVGADEFVRTQGALARSVANEIGTILTGVRRSVPAPAVAPDPAVQDLYLKGRYFMSLGTETGRQQARAFFERALARDPEYAPLHEALATYYILTDAMPADAAVPRARLHADRALALDETSADAHTTLAFLEYYGGWNWSAAEAHFRRALALNPFDTRRQRWYAMYLAAVGRHDEAAVVIDQVLEVDPVSLVALDSAAQVWLHGRRADRLIDVGLRLRALSPGSPLGHEALAGAHVLQEDYVAARDALEEGLRVSDRAPVFVAISAIVHGALGQHDVADAARQELVMRSEQGFIPPFLVAMAHVGARDLPSALATLEHGYKTRDAYLVFLHSSPWMDPLRDEPRFQALVGSMAFQQAPR